MTAINLQNFSSWHDSKIFNDAENWTKPVFKFGLARGSEVRLVRVQKVERCWLRLNSKNLRQSTNARSQVLKILRLQFLDRTRAVSSLNIRFHLPRVPQGSLQWTSQSRTMCTYKLKYLKFSGYCNGETFPRRENQNSNLPSHVFLL